MIQQKLTANLAALRRKRGITQETVADFLGVTKASVSKWETGLSMPDITHLPKLASYYDISIDDLMGYEAQLSPEEIRHYYETFSADFAKRPFEAVMQDIRDFIRQYYSCYPALTQIVLLLLNHYNLAKETMQPDILTEMAELCKRIEEKSTDINLCTDVLELLAVIELLRGNPSATIELLKPYENPHKILGNPESLLVQAYRMNGQTDEAIQWNQVLIFSHLLNLVENTTLYLMSDITDKPVGLETIKRIQTVCEVFSLDKLHPNCYLKFIYAAALFYATHDQKEEALHALHIFVEGSSSFVRQGVALHGDAYFNRLDNYFQEIEAILPTPRHEDTILASVTENLKHPAFDSIRDTQEFQQLERSADKWQH